MSAEERDRLAEAYWITHADAQLAGQQGFKAGWDARNSEIEANKGIIAELENQTWLAAEKIEKLKELLRKAEEALKEIESGQGDPLPGSLDRTGFGCVIRRAERALGDIRAMKK